MAGLGRRTFAPGEVLTASNVMNYLQDQVVQTYADDGARGSAIGTAVSEGMVSYLADVDIVQIYNGSSWLNLGPTKTVFATYSTQVTSSTSTYISTGLTATITPSSVNSKIIVLVSQNGVSKFNNATSAVNLRLLRGATVLTTFGINNALIAVATDLFLGTSSVVYVDSPGTTSAVTYSTQFMNPANIAAAFVQRSSATSTITLIEVA
jgi:hypothetical protein